jgi:uncharacterized protein (DUF1501 family)
MDTAQILLTPGREQPRTLVVVFLRGGADGLALVPPLEDDAYYRARPRLAVSKKDAVLLDGFFGFHPKLAPLLPLFREGELAVVHAAGTEDQTRSHFEAQDLMEHGGLVAGGWLGRFLQSRPASGDGALRCVALGKVLPESLLGAPGVTVLQTMDDFALGAPTQGLVDALSQLYALESGQLGGAARDTFDALARIEGMRRAPYRAGNGAVYGTDEFSGSLREVARLIKGAAGLEAVSIDLGGWDTHFTQSSMLEPLASRLATGLSAFHRDLGPLMAHTSVVVMTEFGRRVGENSSLGTDHGRGSVMFVLGGGLKGGRVIGPWKGLSDGALEGPGDLPVHNNYRNVLVPVLSRHGLADFCMTKVFPGYKIDPVPLYG